MPAERGISINNNGIEKRSIAFHIEKDVYAFFMETAYGRKVSASKVMNEALRAYMEVMQENSKKTKSKSI